MPTPSKRERAIAALKERLARILVANGFSTDAGAALEIGIAPQFGPDDPDAAVALAPGTDLVGFQAGQKLKIVTLPVEIHALARTSLDEPWLTVEAVIADVKRAVELVEDDLDPSDPRRFGTAIVPDGFRYTSTKPLEREPGSLDVGAAVGYDLQIRESWGAP